MDRDSWAQIGMSLKSGLGESGFSLFDGWSKGGKSYNQADCKDTWRSIKPGGGITIKTLFRMAHDDGWERPQLPRTKTQDKPYPGRQATNHTTPKHDPEAIWAACLQEIHEHAYLRIKAVYAFGLRLYQGRLVIGGMDCNGALAMLLVDGTGKAMTIQFIAANGEKRFLPGCPKKGAFHVIGTLTEIIIVCEGCATGSTIHMATGYRVIVAVDSGNLVPVTQTIRTMHPNHTIILAADDDRHLPDNPGLKKATEAAAAIGGYLATPDFGTNRPEGATDFNDLAAFLGLEAVRAQLAGAKRVEAEAAAQTTTQNKKPVTYSLRELMQRHFEDVAFLVAGLLTQGVYILGGKPKIGKSWLSMHLLLSITYGLRVFGSLASTAGLALYVSLEDHDRRLWKRVKQVLRQEPTDNLHFATEWPRIGQGCVEQLDTWLTDHPGTKLVVFDTLARIRPTRKGNDDLYATDYAAVSAFKDVSEKHGITVILVHHLRKMASEDPVDSVSGTTGLTGGVDGTFVLTKKGSEKALTLHRSGRDLIDDEPLTLDWNKESGVWSVLDAATAAQQSVTEAQQQILDVLKAHGFSMSRKEIADATGKESENVRKTLYRMVERGILIKSGTSSAPRYGIAVTPTQPEEEALSLYEGVGESQSCMDGWQSDTPSGWQNDNAKMTSTPSTPSTPVHHVHHVHPPQSPSKVDAECAGWTSDKNETSTPECNHNNNIDAGWTGGRGWTSYVQNATSTLPDGEDF